MRSRPRARAPIGHLLGCCGLALATGSCGRVGFEALRWSATDGGDPTPADGANGAGADGLSGGDDAQSHGDGSGDAANAGDAGDAGDAGLPGDGAVAEFGITIANLRVASLQPRGFAVAVDYLGDTNADARVTLYRCNQTKSPGCAAEMGPARLMVRGAGVFSSVLDDLTAPDDAGDVLRLRVVAVDGDGVSGSPLETTVTLPTTRAIFRSVGPATTWPLASGAGNALTVVAGRADFAAPLPAAIGVGDVVHYDSNADGVRDAVAFVHGRAGDVVLYLRDAAGGLPPTTAADHDWAIYRAYVSLAAAEAGDENPALGVTFDAWSGGRDLVANDEEWNIALYGDQADPGGLVIDGWVTSPTHRLRIFAPAAAAEVGASQRHSGVWDESRASVFADGRAISVVVGNVRLDGLQIAMVNSSGNTPTVYVAPPAGGVRLEGLIIRRLGAGLINEKGVEVVGGSADGVLVANSLISGFGSVDSSCLENQSTGPVFVFNTTMVDCRIGIASGTATAVVINTVVQGASVPFVGAVAAGSDYNVSPTGVGTGGAHDLLNGAITFLAAGVDYRLSATDSTARDSGTDLSAHPVLLDHRDLAGRARGLPWDRGALEGAFVRMVDDDAPAFASGVFVDASWNAAAAALEIDRHSDAARGLSTPDPRGFDTTGLLGVWHLDEATMSSTQTAIADGSGNGLSGTVVTNNGTANKSFPAVIGRGFRGDGNGDYIRIGSPGSVDMLAAFSVGAWVSVPDLTATHDIVIVGKGVNGAGGWRLFLYLPSDGCLQILLHLDYATSDLWASSATCHGVSVDQSAFMHIAATWNGGTTASSAFKLYFNGNEVPQSTTQNAGGARRDDSAGELVLGATGTGTEAFTGTIDEVFLFNRVLSANEVRDLANRRWPLTATLGGFSSRRFAAAGGELVSWRTMLPRVPSAFGRPLSLITDEANGYADGVSRHAVVSHFSFDQAQMTNVAPTNAVADEKTGRVGQVITNDGTGNKSVVGKLGQAFSVNDGDRLTVSNGGGDYTFAGDELRSWTFWYRPESTSGYSVIVTQSDGGGTRFALVRGNTAANWVYQGLELRLLDGSSGSEYYCGPDYMVRDGVWTHVAVTWDGTAPVGERGRMYADGEEVPVFPCQIGGTIDGADLFTDDLEIGGGLLGDDRSTIDELTIWRTALTPRQVATLYLRGAARAVYQIRVCPDAGCSGGLFVGSDGTPLSGFSESLNPGGGRLEFALPRLEAGGFVEYRVDMASDALLRSPALEAMTIVGAVE